MVLCQSNKSGGLGGANAEEGADMLCKLPDDRAAVKANRGERRAVGQEARSERRQA